MPKLIEMRLTAMADALRTIGSKVGFEDFGNSLIKVPTKPQNKVAML